MELHFRNRGCVEVAFIIVESADDRMKISSNKCQWRTRSDDALDTLELGMDLTEHTWFDVESIGRAVGFWLV